MFSFGFKERSCLTSSTLVGEMHFWAGRTFFAAAVRQIWSKLFFLPWEEAKDVVSISVTWVVTLAFCLSVETAWNKIFMASRSKWRNVFQAHSVTSLSNYFLKNKKLESWLCDAFFPESKLENQHLSFAHHQNENSYPGGKGEGAREEVTVDCLQRVDFQMSFCAAANDKALHAKRNPRTILQWDVPKEWMKQAAASWNFYLFRSGGTFQKDKAVRTVSFRRQLSYCQCRLSWKVTELKSKDHNWICWGRKIKRLSYQIQTEHWTLDQS